MEYTKHPLEELTPGELAEIAAYEHGFEPANLQNISSCFEKKIANRTQRKRPGKGLAVILVAAAVLALAGFTNLGRIQRLYNDYFGGAELARYAQEIGASSVDQGIRLEVLTAINDGDNTYLFIDLKDETGGRLTGDLFIDHWNLEGGRDIGGGNCRLVSYDAASGAATLSVHAIGGRPGQDAVFTLSSFFTDEVSFDFTVDTLDLDSLLRENEGKFVLRDKSYLGGGTSPKFADDGLDIHDIEEILEEDALHVEIPGYAKGYLSNIGYRDGKLYIQMNPDNTPGNEALMPHLVHRQTGERLDDYYSLSYGKYPVGEMTYHNDYVEHVFEIGREELKDYALHLYGWYYNQAFAGNWEVAFQVPKQMETLAAAAAVPVGSGGRMVSAVEVSPLSVVVRFSGQATGDKGVEMALVYKDGAKKQMSTPEQDAGEDSLQINGPIQNFEQLWGVEINGTAIELKKQS